MSDTAEQQRIELMPCPFCGSPGKMMNGHPDGFYVTCEKGGWSCGMAELYTYRSSEITKAAAAWNRRSPAIAPQAPASFQARVDDWLIACFGETIARDRIERNHRFIEEALELVQANGCTQSEAHQLVDYVYGRPVGELKQEVGGVMNTLAALCLASGVDLDECAETELARVWTKVEKIRAKQAAKPKHSPLPEHTPQAPAGQAGMEEIEKAAFAICVALRNQSSTAPPRPDDFRAFHEFRDDWVECAKAAANARGALPGAGAYSKNTSKTRYEQAVSNGNIDKGFYMKKPPELQVGSEITVRMTVMSQPDENGNFNAVVTRCKDGGAEWQWLNTDDQVASEGK